MDHPPPNSYTEILTPKVMALGKGAVGRWSGQEGRTCMGFILIKDTPDLSEVTLSLPLPLYELIVKKQLSSKQALTRHGIYLLNLRLPSLQKCEKYKFLFISTRYMIFCYSDPNGQILTQKCFLFGYNDVSIIQMWTFFLIPNKYKIVVIPSLTAYTPRN